MDLATWRSLEILTGQKVSWSSIRKKGRESEAGMCEEGRGRWYGTQNLRKDMLSHIIEDTRFRGGKMRVPFNGDFHLFSQRLGESKKKWEKEQGAGG